MNKNLLRVYSYRKRHTGPSILLLLLFLMCSSVNITAQNVTISPTSGKLVAASTYSGEVGFNLGWNSLWRHDQLPLTLTVADDGQLTSSGILSNPAGNITLDESQNLYVVAGGTSPDSHINISLPNGFRFTGYKIVLYNNISGTIKGLATVAQQKMLYETNSSFNTSTPKKQLDSWMAASNEGTKTYTLERTSDDADPMGNNLYFLIDHNNNSYFAVTIKSIEVFFTAESDFTVPVSPTTALNSGVNLTTVSFQTNKLDLGVIKPTTTTSGNTYYAYNYQNVKDLTASNWLYQENAVVSGNLPTAAGAGSITSAIDTDGKYYFALGNNTYYVESPTSTIDQTGNVIPLGYRIVDARIKYQNNAVLVSGGPISATSDGTTYYLQTDGKWGTNPVIWTLTTNNKLQSGITYLAVNSQGRYTTLNGTTTLSSASTFTITNGNIYFSNQGTLRLVDVNSNASFRTNGTGIVATFLPTDAPSTSSYTLKVYGTDGSVPQEIVIVETGASGIVNLNALNNDAVKFSVEGLTEGTKALITLELTMQSLNPYINKLDVVCHSSKEAGLQLTQQFESNDFAVSGGAFVFYVPSEFIGSSGSCTFTFENLFSKYSDSTYPGGTGFARNYLVRSPYHLSFGDGLQYSASGNEPYTDKIHTEKCGDIAFKFNNADELSNTSGSTVENSLKETPFAEATYMLQGGTFSEQINLTVGTQRSCYLFTGDETRWNIAPTTAMEHRYYAYYLMDFTFVVKDYIATCNLTPIYNTTCYYDNGDVEKAMYGASFTARDSVTNTDINPSEAYLTHTMVTKSLEAAMTNNVIMPDQVLYIDLSPFYSILFTGDELEQYKNTLSPNCLVYLPERSSYNADNFAQKTLSGGFRSCKNIVITDRKPFYAPYKITVPAENYATYTRQITWPGYTQAINSTIILPFTLTVNAEGKHVNQDGNCEFIVNKMNPQNCLQTDGVSTPSDYYGVAHFSPVAEGHTEANVPYMVNVTKAPTNVTVSFTATQFGSDVEATTNMSANNIYLGETAEGTIGGAQFTFQNQGSYSGRKFVAKENKIFYFAQNMFLNCQNLIPQYLYVYPFRAYYTFNVTGQSTKLSSFSVSYEPYDGETTGITNVGEQPDLAVAAGNGSITFTAMSDNHIVLYGVDGSSVVGVNLSAGEAKTIQVPSGIYIINGVKIFVK